MSAAKAKRTSLTGTKTINAKKPANEPNPKRQAIEDAFVESGKVPPTGEGGVVVDLPDDGEIGGEVVEIRVKLKKPDLYTFTTPIEVVLLDQINQLKMELKLAKQPPVSNNDLINEALAMLLDDVEVGKRGDIQSSERAGQWIEDAIERHKERASRRGHYYEKQDMTKGDGATKNRAIHLNLDTYEYMVELQARLQIQKLGDTPNLADLINEAVRDMFDCLEADDAEDPDRASIGAEWLARAQKRNPLMRSRSALRKKK